MARFVLRLTCLLILLTGGIAAIPGTALASPAYECPSYSGRSGAIHTFGNENAPRWGWAYTVHSPACNHWGSVALHEALPTGFQVNVTLFRWNYREVFDHRYCYIRAGGTTCHTPAILTTGCNWTYQTQAKIYYWKVTRWELIAINYEAPQSISCAR